MPDEHILRLKKLRGEQLDARLRTVCPGTYSVLLHAADNVETEIGVFNVADNGEYMVSSRVEKPYRRLGIASAVYKQIEKDNGKALRPSPHYMSTEARDFWKARCPGVIIPAAPTLESPRPRRGGYAL